MKEIINDRVFLPDLLREIKERWGLETALAFADTFGGHTIWLPREPQPDHEVFKVMGRDFMVWLIGARPPAASLLVPLGPQSSYRKRIQLIRRMLQDGHDIREIVQIARCHERTVRRHRAMLLNVGALPEPAQGKLL